MSHKTKLQIVANILRHVLIRRVTRESEKPRRPARLIQRIGNELDAIDASCRTPSSGCPLRPAPSSSACTVPIAIATKASPSSWLKGRTSRDEIALASELGKGFRLGDPPITGDKKTWRHEQTTRIPQLPHRRHHRIDRMSRRTMIRSAANVLPPARTMM